LNRGTRKRTAMTTPMIADFGLRLAAGLAFLLLAAPWRIVPPAFFRTHCLVMLGLLVLAALDEWRHSADVLVLSITIGAAVVAYLGSAFWGLGLVRLGVPATALVASSVGALLIVVSRGPSTSLWMLNGAGRLASAFLMGSTLTAMLLGHHYLTAPAMSIEPLKRFVRAMGASLAIRGTIAAVGLAAWLAGAETTNAVSSAALFLSVRWVVGFGGVLLATVLAWKTVAIRSTQSATGILYIAMTLVLFGELTALILSREAGVTL
jgi:hypothetical protein